MSYLRLVLWIVLVATLIVAVGVVAFRATVTSTAIEPLAVEPGDQEIAWFPPPSNTSTWERFVAGAHHVARQQPRLRVDDRQAFPEQTTAVPELVLSLDGFPGRLRVRWYKQGGQVTVHDWVQKLAARDPAPLAIVG